MQDFRGDNDQRITPAHAGKSYVIGGDTAGEGDHPRTRGEKTP